MYTSTYVFNFTFHGKPSKCLLTKKKPRIRKFPKKAHMLSTEEYVKQYYDVNYLISPLK